MREKYAEVTEKKFTQKDASVIAGVSKGTYSNWEREVQGNNPSLGELKLLAEHYQIPVEHFTEGIDIPLSPDWPYRISDTRKIKAAANKSNIRYHNDLDEYRDIPVIGDLWAHSGGRSGDMQHEPGGAEYYEKARIKGKHAFAMELHGDSMLPRFHDGDVIFFDGEIRPIEICHRKFVAYVLADGSTGFKVCLRANDGRYWFHALNPQYEGPERELGPYSPIEIIKAFPMDSFTCRHNKVDDYLL